MKALFDDRKWVSIARGYRLRPRELDVAKLICQGLSYKGIAGKLRIKATTVKVHISRLLNKVGIHDGISLFRTLAGNEELLRTDEEWAYFVERYKFTPRESEVAKLVCQGLSHRKIAEKLNIRLNTVKTHINHLFMKTNVCHKKMSLFLRFIEDTESLRNKSIV